MSGPIRLRFITTTASFAVDDLIHDPIYIPMRMRLKRMLNAGVIGRPISMDRPGNNTYSGMRCSECKHADKCDFYTGVNVNAADLDKLEQELSYRPSPSTLNPDLA